MVFVIAPELTETGASASGTHKAVTTKGQGALAPSSSYLQQRRNQEGVLTGEPQGATCPLQASRELGARGLWQEWGCVSYRDGSGPGLGYGWERKMQGQDPV